MTKYESLYIISTTIGDEAIAEKIAKFSGIVESNGGSIVSVDTDSWGKRKLAYAINYETEGYYVLMTFEGDSELPKELERNFKNDENILRFIVTRAEA
ncbi:MAG: 30S ribosomal protein S6 [Clostridia bacterium]|nr:30S ribosomal protein S6 [Clostridia bacterium]